MNTTPITNRRILVIDDDAAVLNVYRRLFRETSVFSFEVVTASQGEEGYQLAQKALQEQHPFAVAFVDMRIPPGMNGLKTAQKLRHLDEKLYIVIVTAYADHTIDELNEAVQHDLLLIKKPFTSEEIYQIARTLIRAWEQREELERYHLHLEKLVASRTQELLDHKKALDKSALVERTDSKGRFLDINETFCALIGYPREELIGQTVQKLDAGYHSKAFWRTIQKTIDSGEIFRGEVCLRHKNGSQCWLDTTLLPLRNIHGEIYQYMGVRFDITERKHMEEQRQYAAFQSGIAEMSTSILHNVGNAITGIVTRVERVHKESHLLREMALRMSELRNSTTKQLKEGRPQEQVMDNLLNALTGGGAWMLRHMDEGLLKNTKQIGKAVEYIADIIRIQQNAAKPEILATFFSMRQLIEDVVAMQHETLKNNQIKITTQVEAPTDRVHLPRNQLLQVFLNLLKNACESIEKRSGDGHDDRIGGEILIDLQSDQDDDAWIVIRVRDDGIGISENSLQQIFEHSYSTKQRGTGFGLHSVATFIQSLNGHVTAESAGEKEGATFTIRLPKNVSDRSNL